MTVRSGAKQGQPLPGHFVVTAAQADGTLTASLASAIYAAVDLVRPICSTFSVQPPAVIYADVSLSVVALPASAKAAAVAAVETAIVAYVASLAVGQALAYNRLAVLAFGASTSVANVLSIRLNSGGADLTPPANGIVRLRTLSVS